MTLERYYLVRRDHREFIGPMGVDEFQQRLERMEFGLQDEVSGHCGPWVVLDHKEDLTKHYPQIVAALGDSLSLSWREATGHARVISKQDSRRERRKPKPQKRIDPSDHKGFNEFIKEQKRKSQRMRVAAITIVVSAIAIAGFIITRKDEIPSSAEYASLMTKSDPSEFLNLMGLKVIPYPQKYLKTPKHQAQWLPLFRMYAFYTTGAIDGVPQKLLRGDQQSTAPVDCSVENWKQRWRESSSQTIQFIQGKALPRNQWTKILSLDPNWVRRRAAKGWAKPRNYFEGCLMTASMAIKSLGTDPGMAADAKDDVSPEIFEMVSRRLQQQLEMISDGRISAVFDKSNLLGVMSCLESAGTLQELEQCRVTPELALKPVIDEKSALGLLRIAVMQQAGALDPKVAALLAGSVSKIDVEDQMSRLDMTPEYRLVTYLSTGNAVDQSLSKVDQEFKEIKFR
jgi:hypothetical protein